MCLKRFKSKETLQQCMEIAQNVVDAAPCFCLTIEVRSFMFYFV